MPIITEITAVGKLLLDAISAIRGITREKAADKRKLFNPRLLAEMHFYLTSLQANVKKIIGALERSNLKEVKLVWKEFSLNLLHFSERFKALNLGIIEIYHPGLGAKLARAYGLDSIVYGYFRRVELDTMVSTWDISRQQKHFLKINKQLDMLGLDDLERRGVMHAIHAGHSMEECKAELELLATALKECAELLGTFMKNNWAPRDLS